MRWPDTEKVSRWLLLSFLEKTLCYDRDGGRAGGRRGDLLVFIKETRDRLQGKLG